MPSQNSHVRGIPTRGAMLFTPVHMHASQLRRIPLNGSRPSAPRLFSEQFRTVSGRPRSGSIVFRLHASQRRMLRGSPRNGSSVAMGFPAQFSIFNGMP